MGVKHVNQEFRTSIAPSRMFQAMILDAHNLIPKLIPQIKSIEFAQGDGGVDTIKITNFADGSAFKYMKHKIDEMDKEKYTCKYTMIESDILGDKLEKIVYDVSFCADGSGSIYKINSEIYTKGDNSIKDEDIKDGQEKARHLYKIIEEHLMANPNLYK